MATSYDKKRTLLTEVPSSPDKQLLTSAIEDAQKVREQAFLNAEKSIRDAFGKKFNVVYEEQSPSTPSETVSEEDIDTLINEIEEEEWKDDALVKECKKRLDEAKSPSITHDQREKMYKDIHRKFSSYIQSLPNKTIPVGVPEKKESEERKINGMLEWISYEGSMIISSLIAVSDKGIANINLNQLPEADRSIISKVSAGYAAKGFSVSFDSYKNFVCYADDNVVCYTNDNRYEKGSGKFILGNRITSIPPNESNRFGNSDVRVEDKGKQIVIGDKIRLEKDRIQNLVASVDNTSASPIREGYQPRHKVAGRNAFEIRTDILEISYDFVKTNSKGEMKVEDVVDVAWQLYNFVENRR